MAKSFDIVDFERLCVADEDVYPLTKSLKIEFNEQVNQIGSIKELDENNNICGFGEQINPEAHKSEKKNNLKNLKNNWTSELLT